MTLLKQTWIIYDEIFQTLHRIIVWATYPQWPSIKGCLNHSLNYVVHGPLARYVKLRVAHAPGLPGTVSPVSQVSDPEMHHGTCMTQVPWCMPGSLTSGFFGSRWRGKHSRHSQGMRIPQFCISGKGPMNIIHEVAVHHISNENQTYFRKKVTEAEWRLYVSANCVIICSDNEWLVVCSMPIRFLKQCWHSASGR